MYFYNLSYLFIADYSHPPNIFLQFNFGTCFGNLNKILKVIRGIYLDELERIKVNSHILLKSLFFRTF